jgi:predicted nucleic acid-binding protein
MAVVPRYLVDTNILLRISRESDPQHELIGASLKELEKQGSQLCYALQNIAESWSVCTRPAASNGYGLSIPETNQRVEYIERTMTHLPDSERVYSIWRQLVIAYKVHGIQVHDARGAAIMQAYGVTHILTLNQADFLRYAGVAAVHPGSVLMQGR